MENTISNYIDEIEKNIGTYKFDINIIVNIALELNKIDDISLKESMLDKVYQIIEDKKDLSFTNTILLYSLLIQCSNREKYICNMANYILNDDSCSWQTLYFLYQKMARQNFLYPKLNTYEINRLEWIVLKRSLELFKKVTYLDLAPIPEKELLGNTVVLITDQFTNYNHGPTKTTVDRAYTLKKMFGNVFIINTAESWTNVGAINFLSCGKAIYNSELLNVEQVEWKGKCFGYFQCEQNMPNEDVMGMLLDVIRRLKPTVCVCVGGDSFFAGVVNEIIPVVAVGTTQSNLMKTLCDYQIADEYQVQLDRKLIKEMKYEGGIIPGKFTFSLKESNKIITRKDIGLENDAFVIAIVGGRLETEITDELWDELSKLYNENVVIVTIGNYGKKEKVNKKYFEKINLLEMGSCDDVIAILKVVDLYVNPLRKGGATSAVEALSVGVPVLTVNYGDVAGTVGEEFRCNSLSKYSEIICRYIYNKEFYESQSNLAKQRAEELMDTEHVFVKEIKEYLKRRKGY